MKRSEKNYTRAKEIERDMRGKHSANEVRESGKPTGKCVKTEAKRIALELRKTTSMTAKEIVQELKERGEPAALKTIHGWCLKAGYPFRKYAFTSEMRQKANELRSGGSRMKDIALWLSEKYGEEITEKRLRWELSDKKKQLVENAKIRKAANESEQKELWQIAEDLEAKGWTTADANTEILKRWVGAGPRSSEYSPRSTGKTFSIQRRRWAA